MSRNVVLLKKLEESEVLTSNTLGRLVDLMSSILHE